MKLTYNNVRPQIWCEVHDTVWDYIDNPISTSTDYYARLEGYTRAYLTSLARSVKYDVARSVEFTCKDRIWMGIYETIL